MPVDWLKLIQQHNIDHSVQRDELLVRCPWCGDADPSQHLSINLRGRGYRCLRQPQRHKGKSAVRLAAALFRCDEARARKIVGLQEAPLPARDEFKEQWRRQLGLDPAGGRPTKLAYPDGFYSLSDKYHHHSPFAVTFWNYLKRRGFTGEEIRFVAERYQLHYTITGEFAYRLIIPIFDEAGRLATWTGRTIGEGVAPRYKTLHREQSVQSPSDLLLGFNWLVNAAPSRCLVICEGPLDAIKVTALGAPHGIFGTCLFGKQISRAQTGYLYALGQFFGRLVLVLDKDAYLNNLEIACSIPGCQIATLPDGVKDPGDLQDAKFLLSLLEEP